jgi:hypothetical protein
MKHPKSSDVRKVIALLTSVLPMATREDHLSMSEVRVKIDGHICGTVHCHGGWFAIANNIHLRDEKTIMYDAGSDLMARMIGFQHDVELGWWARLHKQIWGNPDGGYLFRHARAFYHPTKRPHGAKNLQHIIDHWSECATRLEALEQQPEFNIPPMTVNELIGEKELV